MMKKTIIIVAVVVFAVVFSLIALFDKDADSVQESATAKSVRLGESRIVCEDAVWLAETFGLLIEEKKEQISKDEEQDFTKKDFESMPTTAQKMLDAWRDGTVVAAAETYVADPQTLNKVNDEIGRQFMEIYQAAMFVELGVADIDGLMAAVREGFCTE